MKKFLVTTFFIATSLLFNFNIFAGPPEMSKKDLERKSNTIVKGRVVKVKCTGEIREEYCATLTGYTAKVQIHSVLKGEPFESLDLHFYKYDFNKNCMGTEYTRHYKDEEAIYYLNCDVNQCRFTNWNGVEYIKKSRTPLPKCKKRKKKR